MPDLAPETIDYLADVVLDELAPRSDRLFALDQVLRHAGAHQLSRIAQECRDPFFRRITLLESARHEAIAEMRVLERGLAPPVFE